MHLYLCFCFLCCLNLWCRVGEYFNCQWSLRVYETVMETFLSSRLRFCDKLLNDTFVFLSFVEQMDSKTVTPEDTVEPGVRVVFYICLWVFLFFCLFLFFSFWTTCLSTSVVVWSRRGLNFWRLFLLFSFIIFLFIIILIRQKSVLFCFPWSRGLRLQLQKHRHWGFDRCLCRCKAGASSAPWGPIFSFLCHSL